MKTIIIANWKCNPQTLAKAKELFDKVADGLKDIKNAEVIICPPFPYLFNLKSDNLNIKLGSQDVFWGEGTYTGEVSPKMLKDLGCEYVILGHSERRRNLGETDEMINKKVKAALSAGLLPILCIGETGEEKSANKTKEVLEKQLKGGLEVSIVAYEPIWAIGTGNACDIDQARKVKLFLEKIIKSPILYGGSVDSKNALGYIKDAGFAGLLVGGASLIPEEFIKIVNAV